MNLVLIGYRGTGKTSVADEMAKRLSWRVVSTDDLICKRAGKGIPEIVADSGWEAFRDLEASVVKEVSLGDKQIIDTGGGAVLRAENLAALRENGLLIWLRATVETIQKRILGDTQRPSLTKVKNTIDEVEGVLRQRTPLYQDAADYYIYTDNRGIEDICDQIMGILHNKQYGLI